MKTILLTNDDGVAAEGLRTLSVELRNIAHVLVVAPEQNRSAISHGLTIHSRMKFEEIEPDNFSLNGTPADCVIHALGNLFVNPPDLVISGINHGANLGDDIMYSGTVAAAREAARYGIPAIAVSQEYDDGKKIRFTEGSILVKNMVLNMFRNGINGELLLNINIPMGKIKGLKITRQAYSEQTKHFDASNSKWNAPPHDSLYFLKNEISTDRKAVSAGYVSITPLQRDQTDYLDAQSLFDSAEQLFGKA